MTLQIADCLALFALLEQSLKTGMPLPPTMPIFERLAYHHAHHRGDRDGDVRYGRNDLILPARVKGGGAADQDGKEKSTSTLGDKDKDARVEERIEKEEEKVFVDLGKTFNWDTLRVSRVDKTIPRLFDFDALTPLALGRAIRRVRHGQRGAYPHRERAERGISRRGGTHWRAGIRRPGSDSREIRPGRLG